LTGRRQMVIRTAEGVRFALPLAGPLSRMFAVMIDLATVAVITEALGKVFGAVGILSPQLSSALRMIGAFAAGIGYPIASEWFWRGQTVGKRVMGLRVVDAEGRRVTWPQIVVRNLLRPVDMLPAFYLVGGVAAWWNQHAQRLGDLAARTIVVRVETVTEPDVEQLLGGKYNSLAEHRHLAARLRQRVTPDLAGLALESLLRRNDLDAATRVELFGKLAERFRGLAAFPAEAVEQLSDEQYVRNAVLVLYRTPEATRLQ
jgi:uncharacterized RDD family membrane protein YckC